MKFTLLRKMEYEETFIYIAQVGSVFQYMFSWNGEIYVDFINAKVSFINKIKKFFGAKKFDYSIDELEELEKVLLSGAMDSIDKIIAQGGRTRQFAKRKEKQIQAIKEDITDRSKLKCVWRAIDMGEEFRYECLTHGILVKMKDGEEPKHDIISPLQVEVTA